MSLLVLFTLAPMTARAEEPVAAAPSRGFLTGLGIGLLVVGLGGAGVGAAGVAVTADGQRLLGGFGQPLQTEDVSSYRAIEARVVGAVPLMVAGFVTAGVGLVGAILCLVLDTPKAPVQVSIAPTLQGGAFSVSWSF